MKILFLSLCVFCVALVGYIKNKDTCYRVYSVPEKDELPSYSQDLPLTFKEPVYDCLLDTIIVDGCWDDSAEKETEDSQ